ncbi:MAG: ABC transporter permease subunit [Planctomycetaceae bacterium]
MAADGRLFGAPLDVGHPESALSAYFRPIWYESYAEPQHVWQSSSGTNAVEAKLGLVPLVFGTLKATFYSMLFGVPLALLAALYTSEFLSKSARARVKPVIEIMASLPSVVLGFLAAIVFAPIVEDWLPSVIAAGLTVPLSLLAAAHLWQLGSWSMLPRWERWRLPLAGVAIVAGFLLAALLGPVLEALFFAGNVKLWLDGQIGSAAGAWMLMLVPICAVGVAAAMIRWLNPIVTEASSRWGRRRFATVDLLRFAGAVIVTLAVAGLLSYLFAGLDALLQFDLDPRGSFLDTYVQRNALVVGFVMGFAIIPLIYTLADDALNAVPESLRSASLGAGATPWQTALRVVIPTAMSGLFSAIMVGLGRAVGETMIVLMAAGNTPIMELNIFNGFQTLSAAIATEMPEAVRGSTHFRTLFLAALVLFGLTFLVNTVAELVRIRFRRRVVQL